MLYLINLEFISAWLERLADLVCMLDKLTFRFSAAFIYKLYLDKSFLTIKVVIG